MKRLLHFITLFFIASGFLFSQTNNLEISREFSVFTSQQASGYLKPLFTTIGESFNSGLYSTANYKNGWSFGLDFTVTGMAIPNEQREYQALLPDKFGDESVTKNAWRKVGQTTENLSGYVAEPTLYGGRSTSIFAAPQGMFAPDSFYKSVGFVEGNDVSFMSGLPVIQMFVGLPSRTQLRLRFLGAPISGVWISYYTIAINQNIDKIFGNFLNANSGLALNFAYHSLQRNPGIDISSWSLGAHYSYEWNSGFGLYCGAQYENLKGSIQAVRKSGATQDVVNNPYSEIRNLAPLNIDVASYTDYRVGGGVSFRTGFLALNAGAFYASQPVFSAGASFYFFDKEYYDRPTAPILPDMPMPIEEKAPEFADVPTPTLEVAIPEAKIEEKTVKTYNLKADVQVLALENGVEKPLMTIKTLQNISRHMSPLLPMVFFDDNSAEIPQRYVLLAKSDIAKKKAQHIAEGDALQNYYQALNIIGERMNKYPKAKLTLTGANSDFGAEKNNMPLSKKRAENVKAYLVNVWGIDSNRIAVKFRNKPVKFSNPKDEDGRSENRRVEIVSDTWEVTAPSILQDTSRTVMPPMIRIKPSAIAEAGLKKWSVLVTSGTTTLKSYASVDSTMSNIDWPIDKEETVKAMIKQNISYSISATDANGASFNSETKTLPVETTVISNASAKSGDTIRNVYDLILFDFNKSDIKGENKRIIDMIKKESPANALIKISGYTDRIGDEEYNRKLSASRAKSTARALTAKAAETKGVGEDALLYDNSLPEGRFYCRTVMVEVLIPIMEVK